MGELLLLCICMLIYNKLILVLSFEVMMDCFLDLFLSFYVIFLSWVLGRL